MTLRGLALREILRRPRGLILSILATLVATAAFISVENTSRAALKTVRKLMLKLGHNYLIVPRGAPHDRVWAAEFGRQVMPEFYLDTLKDDPTIAALRYVGMLERRVSIGKVVAVLTGVRFELGRYGELTRKPPYPPGFEAFDINKPGDAYLGYEAARALGKKVGESLEIEGETFSVARILPREGTIDDLRIFITLPKAQEMYARIPGHPSPGYPPINALMAFGCVCPVEGKFSTVTAIQRMIERHYARVAAERGTPRPEVIPLRSRFEARADARRMLKSVGGAIAAALLVLCGLAVAFYIYLSTTRQRYEIALLGALGYPPAGVTAMVLAKVLLVALFGGAGGLAAGLALAAGLGPNVVGIRSVPPQWELWWQALLFAGVLCLGAAVVAVVSIRRIDPAQQLRNQ